MSLHPACAVAQSKIIKLGREPPPGVAHSLNPLHSETLSGLKAGDGFLRYCRSLAIAHDTGWTKVVTVFCFSSSKAQERLGTWRLSLVACGLERTESHPQVSELRWCGLLAVGVSTEFDAALCPAVRKSSS